MNNDASLHRTVVVRNAEGLHARPADLLVRLASRYQATIQIGKNNEWVDCKSILSLLTLGAAQGTELSVSAQGPDAAEAIDSITAFVEAGFNDTGEIRGAYPAI